MHEQYEKLLQEKNDITQKYKDCTDWSKVENEFKIIEVSAGIFVRCRESGNSPSQSNYWLCATCFEDRKKSILQKLARVGSNQQYKCPRCKNMIVVR